MRAAGVGLLLVLLAWNLAELTAKSGLTGLAERFMGDGAGQLATGDTAVQPARAAASTKASR